MGKQISAPYPGGDYTNFAPRLGLSGKRRTVIHVGGGIIYEQVNRESFLAFNDTLGINGCCALDHSNSTSSFDFAH